MPKANNPTEQSMSDSLTHKISRPMREAVGLLSVWGVEGYLVGGCVRDALIGRDNLDVDLLIRGDACSVGRKLAECMGGSYTSLHQNPNIARVLVESENGVSCVLDISSLDSPLVENLAHRDFTINALAVPLDGLLEGAWYRENVVDPLNGLRALEQGVVEVVGGRTFVDDPLRLLRAVRLGAQLGFQIGTVTKHMIANDAHLVESVAGERVRNEFLKTLAVKGASPNLRFMDEVGLLCRVFPELELGRGVAQPQEHYWDVFCHNLETPGMIECLLHQSCEDNRHDFSIVPWRANLKDHFATEVCDGFSHEVFLKLAGLLHDIGKPGTKTIQPSGRTRFLGHHVIGSQMAEEVMRRLRIGAKGVRLVKEMVYHHLRPGQLSQSNELPTRRAIYRYYRDVGEAALDTLYLNLADYLAARGPNVQQEDWSLRCKSIGTVLTAPEETVVGSPMKLLDGHDIMNILDLEPGPLVGRLLDLIREGQMVGEIRNRGQALAVAQDALSGFQALTILPQMIEHDGELNREIKA